MKNIIKTTMAGVAAGIISGAALDMPQKYAIDENHTFPRFSYDHLGFSTQLSRFDRTTGTVVYDEDGRMTSVDIVIDMKSVNTGSKTFDEHIQGTDFLNTSHYPKAFFKSTNVTMLDGIPKTIEGELTICGVSKFVTLDITSFKRGRHPMLGKDAIGANARTTVRRSEFGLGKYIPAVGDEVRIDIAIEAISN